MGLGVNQVVVYFHHLLLKLNRICLITKSNKLINPKNIHPNPKPQEAYLNALLVITPLITIVDIINVGMMIGLMSLSRNGLRIKEF